jgi:predicted Zn-dependent peptidase
MNFPDRSIAPEFVKPQIFKLPVPENKTLSNGVPYFELLTGAAAAVKVELIFNSGLLYEAKNGVAYFTAKLLTSGTSKLSAAQIEERFAAYGAFVELNAGHDHGGVTIYCLSRFVKEVLLIVRELLTDCRFPEEEIVNLKHIQTQNYRVNLEKTGFLATKAFKENFFRDKHPYSRVLTSESIAAITRDDLKDFYSRVYNLNNCNIFVSGGGVSTLINEFEEVFGIHKITQKVFPVGLHARFGKGKVHVEKKGALQSSIRVGLPSMSYDDPEYHKVSFLNEVFGGYFGSRLMKNIREEKGFTYGIHSSVVSLLRASYFVIGTDVKKEVADLTLEEIFKEAHKLKTIPVPQGEIETVKNYMIGSFLNSINTPYSLMDRFKIIYFHSLPADFFEIFYSLIDCTSSEEVMEAANLFFIDDQFLSIIAG